MTHLVLEIDGKFDKGFIAKLRGSHFLNYVEKKGKLPANQHLLELYQQWQRRYSKLEGTFKALSHGDPDQITNSSDQENAIIACQKAGIAMEKELNNWLNFSEEFEDIKNKLLNIGKDFRIWLQTDNIWLQKLPWEKWDLLQNAQAETAIIVSQYDVDQRQTLLNKNKQPQILAVIGGADDLLFLAEDEKVLEELMVNNGAKITWLKSPKVQELTELLREGQWDILFFSGHSASYKDPDSQEWEIQIQLNKKEQVKISDVRFSLKEATKKGLKLAIFNSCDGIGVAHELAREQGIVLPHLIFMREKLPDAISPKFLRYFLKSFTANESLYKSVHTAQQILHDDWESKYPCVSWLPVICPNPAEDAPTWNSLSLLAQKRHKRNLLGVTLAIAFAVTGLVVGIREVGLLEDLELKTYDKMLQFRRQFFPDKPDENIVVITIDDSDLEYQDQKAKDEPKWSRYRKEIEEITKGKTKEASISDIALSKLLQKLNEYEPSAIGLDIFRPFPATDSYLREQLRTNDHLFVICSDFKKVSSPSELTNRKRMGFSDVPIDDIPIDEKALDNKQNDPQEKNDRQENMVRRYLWAARFGEDSPCLPYQSASNLDYDAFPLGYLLAKEHLKKQGKSLPEPSESTTFEIKKGKANFQSVNEAIGGPYRKDRKNEFEAGRQILLNYRNTIKDSGNNDEIAYSYNLEDILKDNFSGVEKIKDKIVLIGVTAKKSDDSFMTPFSKNSDDRMWGIYLHAHIISNILSSVEQDSTFILLLNRREEALWILVWSIIGGLIAYYYDYRYNFITYIVISILLPIALFVICWLLLITGYWLPYIPPILALVATNIGVIVFRVTSSGKAQIIKI